LPKSRKFSKKFARFLYLVQVGSQKYVRMLIFSHILLIAKIWLNWLIDDPHLSYIRKLEKNALKGIPRG
jgi:hypothetical protein